MAKVFRIFNNGDHTSNWFNSFEIGSGVVDAIEVEETDGKRLPTSIPSPFAQIDLVRSAFKTVCDGYLAGTSLNDKRDAHRIVSNALDVGQILFNFEKNSKNLTLEVWDKYRDLDILLNSENRAVAHLGRSIKLFLESEDAKTYNFNILEKFFIVKYNNRVIGGTSPKTLFFASSDATNLNVNIYCGNDKMLDDQPLALYKREKDYIKYLYELWHQPNFPEYFPEVYQYLDLTIRKIEEKDIEFGNLLRSNHSESNFPYLTLPQNPGVAVEILPGFTVKKEIPQDPSDSDFIISSRKELARPPLVLPVDSFSEKIIYTNEIWKSETEVPLYDKRSLEERTLPRVNNLYPYLTLADFLTENLLRLQYKVDSDNYFAIPGFEEFLIPLTSRFFDYFTAEELVTREFLKMRRLAGDIIEVQLDVPIKTGRSIPYVKKYSTKSNLQLDSNKLGTIKDVDLTLGIYPFVKSQTTSVDYTIAFAEKNTPRQLSHLFLIDEENQEVNVKPRDRMNIQGLHSTYFITNKSAEFLILESLGTRNMIIPRWKIHNNTGLKYSFSIDLGTTNTHIEYITNQTNFPESYKLENEHFVYLRNLNLDIRGQAKVNSEVCEQLLNQEVIHNDLGNDRYSFPFRSVLFENKTIKYDQATFLHSDVNIGFDYGKVGMAEHLQEVTNLKWLPADRDNNNKRIEKFIEQLLLLCKNKVLMTNGNIDHTKIVWLYPTSMTHNQLGLFKEIWFRLFKKIFNTSDSKNLIPLPESIAPFYYYTGYDNLMNQTRPTASIDIGGGTTDVTIFEEDEPKLISSFKFAGDTIFGDGYSNNIGNNGFIRKYHSVIKRKLEANKDFTSTEMKILEDIFSRSKSTDVSNYFFTLKDNYHLQKENIDIDYSSLLKNDGHLKLVFLVFYSALVYHVAQLMKANGSPIPQNILFSGTASKSINLLDPTLTRVNVLFEEIFKEVYDMSDGQVKVTIDPSPKIITAKGALKYASTIEKNEQNKKGKMLSSEEIEKLIFIHPGNAEYNCEKLTYGDIDNNLLSSVVENSEEFFYLLDQVNGRIDFVKSFGISPSAYDVFTQSRRENLKDFLLKGLKERKDNQKATSEIEETLFFYSFTGILNDLASKVEV